MDIVLHVVLIAMLGVASWVIYRNREQLQVHESTEGSLRKWWYQEQENSVNWQTQLKVLSVEYQQQQTAISAATNELNHILQALPPIENTSVIHNRMTEADFKRLDIPFGMEFQRNQTQLLSQQNTAIEFLNEAGYQIALRINYLKMEGISMAPSTQLLLGVMGQMRGILEQYVPAMYMSGFKEDFAKIMAINSRRLQRVYLDGEEQPSEAEIARWMDAIDEVRAQLENVEDAQVSVPLQVEGEREKVVSFKKQAVGTENGRAHESL
jgi:hypothetical protein